jgi:hypothetical protein
MKRLITIGLKKRIFSKGKGYHRFFEGSNLSGAGDPHGLFLKFGRLISARLLSRKSGPKGKASGNPVSIPELHLYRILTPGGQGLGPGYRFALAGTGIAYQVSLNLPPRRLRTFFRVKRGIQRSAMPVERVIDRQSGAPT